MLNWWYNLIDFILPFEWSRHVFMKDALLAILLVMPVFGMLGTMVVSNRMAFFSDSLGHGAFTGIAIGAALGGIKPIWAATIFSIIFAIAITFFKNKSRASTDTVIGVFSSTAIALGLVIMSYGGQFKKFQSYLVGDLLSVSNSDILMLCIVFVLVILLWLIIFNKLLVVSINQSLAKSRGMNTLMIEVLFTISIAVVVTISIQWVGLLIINSMLVLPAAAARNVTVNVRRYHFISIVTALVSGVSGLIVSFYLNTVTGATIVLFSAVFFFITFSMRRRFI
ncbi:MAG: metal ABC transporter permease [Bacillota bacterium]|nr:metal ABC transporter permease [Bacillota bacterium]